MDQIVLLSRPGYPPSESQVSALSQKVHKAVYQVIQFGQNLTECERETDARTWSPFSAQVCS